MVLRFAAGFSRSFSFSFRPSSPPPPPRRSRSLHSFFSPLDFGIYKYRYRASPLLYNTAALLLRRALSILLRHHSLPPCPPSYSPSPSRPSTRLVLLSPLLRPLSSPRALLQRVQRAAHSRYIPRWVSNTYLHGRGTTVSVPGQLLTRSTHRDCPRAPP